MFNYINLMLTFPFRPLKRNNKFESTWANGRGFLSYLVLILVKYNHPTPKGLPVTLHFLDKYMEKSVKHEMQS